MSALNQPFAVDFEGDLWGDHAESDTFESSESRELTRGLLVSPEKPGAKGKKFLKGGLAERAQTIVNRSQTSYTLWQKDIEVHLRAIPSGPNAHSFTSYRRALRPDLLLRVVSVLRETRISGTSRGAGSLRSVLARCDVQQTGRDALSTTPTAQSTTTLLVLFSFSPEVLARASVTSSDPTFDMVEGVEIMVWKPFHEVVLSREGASAEASEKALFCSRFLAIPPS